ncbi:MAG: hypothetical protein AAF744_05180 [Pseudomonadota bacterium]
MPLLLFATSASAWEFTPGTPCILTQESPELTVTLTHDPTAPLYSITITRPEGLPQSPTFGLAFDGPAPLTIGTDRHRYHVDGTQVSVEDTGFGNVLNGMQFNHTMRALFGEAEISIPLEGAADPVEAFRACAPAAAV